MPEFSVPVLPLVIHPSHLGFINLPVSFTIYHQFFVGSLTDNRTVIKDYNEVGVMKAYMTEKGIPESVVFTDHAGFDTYDTMYRARDIFKAKKVLIVTQDFHISRAVYIARSLGLEAYGYACDGKNTFAGFRNEGRETMARAKYVLNSMFKPQPKYLGEEIPIWGDASASNG